MTKCELLPLDYNILIYEIDNSHTIQHMPKIWSGLENIVFQFCELIHINSHATVCILTHWTTSSGAKSWEQFGGLTKEYG